MIPTVAGLVLRNHDDGQLYAVERFDNCEPFRMQLRCLTVARQWAPWAPAEGFDPERWTAVFVPVRDLGGGGAMIHLAPNYDEATGQRCRWCGLQLAQPGLRAELLDGWPGGAVILDVPHPDGSPGRHREVLTYDDEGVAVCSGDRSSR